MTILQIKRRVWQFRKENGEAQQTPISLPRSIVSAFTMSVEFRVKISRGEATEPSWVHSFSSVISEQKPHGGAAQSLKMKLKLRGGKRIEKIKKKMRISWRLNLIYLVDEELFVNFRGRGAKNLKI